MSDFRINDDMFGRYVKIPTDFCGQLHVYKVVGLLESNGYCDVPITGWSKEEWHSEIVPVLQVIHCGVCEENVVRVALKDCLILEDKDIPKTPCFLCDNARVNDELTEENDLHYHTIGKFEDGFRALIGGGDGKPLRILFEQRRCLYKSRPEKEWVTVGIYEPPFCPNCGRELSEYRR